MNFLTGKYSKSFFYLEYEYNFEFSLAVYLQVVLMHLSSIKDDKTKFTYSEIGNCV